MKRSIIILICLAVLMQFCGVSAASPVANSAQTLAASSGDAIVSPTANAVSGDADVTFRVTAEAEAGDSILLCVDGEVMSTINATAGTYDYAVDIDHTSWNAGSHILAAYKMSGGTKVKIAEKALVVKGIGFGDIHLSNPGGTAVLSRTYPKGVGVFDELSDITTSEYVFSESPFRTYDDEYSKFCDSVGCHIQTGSTAPVAWKGLVFAQIVKNEVFTYDKLEIQMDLRRPAINNPIALFDIPLWHTYATGDERNAYLVDSTGKIAGTDVDFEANTWITLKMLWDIQGETWSVWKNGTLIIDKAPQGNRYDTDGRGEFIGLSLPYAGTYLYFNNVSIRRYASVNPVSAMAYNTASASGNATNGIGIPADTASVAITLAAAPASISNSDITLKVNGVSQAVSSSSYDSSTGVVTVPVSNLADEDVVSVTIAGDSGDVDANFTVTGGGGSVVPQPLSPTPDNVFTYIVDSGFAAYDNVTDPVTFDNAADASDSGGTYTRFYKGSNLTFDFKAAGRSGNSGDYAVYMKSNTADSFEGLSNGSWDDPAVDLGGWDFLWDDHIANAYDNTVNNKGESSTVEFDIKLDTNTDAYGLCFFPTWIEGSTAADCYKLFGADGKIAGTDYSYSADTWYHFKWVTEGKKAYVYVTPAGGTEELIVNGDWSIYGYSDPAWRSTFFISQGAKGASDEKAGMTVDNWRFYSVRKTVLVSPTVSSVSNDEDVTFRVKAEAEAGDIIQLCADGEVLSSVDATAGTYDYAVTIAHSSWNEGSHVLTAYKISADGFKETLAEKAITVAGLGLGDIRLSSPDGSSVLSRTYPKGVGVFDEVSDITTSDYVCYESPFRTYDNKYEKFCDSVGCHIQTGSDAPAAWCGLVFAQIVKNDVLSYDKLEIQMDLRRPDRPNPIAMFDIPLWNTYATGDVRNSYLVDTNGKISGTDVDFEANTWITLKMLWDIQGKTWSVWKNGTLIIDKAPQGNRYDTDGRGEFIGLSLPYSGTYLYFNNVSIRRYATVSPISQLAYTSSSESNVVTDGIGIPTDTEWVAVTLADIPDTVLDSDIVLKVNGVSQVVSGSSYDPCDGTVEVPVSGLSHGDVVTVSVTKTKAVTASFTVAGKELAVAQTAVNGSTARVQIYNGGDADIYGARLFAGVYSDSTRAVLEDIVQVEAVLTKGDNYYEFTFAQAPTGKNITLFVWQMDNASLIPLLSTTTVQ